MKDFCQLITDLLGGETCFSDNDKLNKIIRMNRTIRMIKIIKIIKIIKMIKTIKIIKIVKIIEMIKIIKIIEIIIIIEIFKMIKKILKIKIIKIIKIQGVSKKMGQCLFCKFLSNQVSDFQILFLKTEIHMQILNTQPFLCDIRGPGYLQNKMRFSNRLFHSHAVS